MTREELNIKYCIDISLSEYKLKKDLRNSANNFEKEAHNVHKWKAAFVKEMKKYIPNYNGSSTDVDRTVDVMMLAKKTPETAAKIVFEKYKKMKQSGHSGAQLYKNLSSKPGSSMRSQAQKERYQLANEARQYANKLG